MPRFALRRLVDDVEWEAEDLAGRMGIVAHAAFLRAGFVPYGEKPRSGHLLKKLDEIGPSTPCLSRRYTAAQLVAHHEGGGGAVDAAVLELRVWGNGDVTFHAYLLTTDGDRGFLSYEADLDEDTLAPILSCRLADAALALETRSAGAWLWKSLADWVFPAMFLDLYHRNDLPVTGFASLPDDATMEILKRLNGKDLARVECTSKQLRFLVTERDGVLWKAVYESLSWLLEVESSDSESDGLGSWKQRYVNAWQRPPRYRFMPGLFSSNNYDADWLPRRNRQREPNMQDFAFPWRRIDPSIFPPMGSSRGYAYPPEPDMVHDDPPAPPPARNELAPRGKNAGRQQRKMQRNDCQKKNHDAGAIHSPSSRYRWRHR
ncbi:hypothetical protein QOZ80_5BG0421130 [Eleusine coracana subsp. coracana]|nr:hypothetical protein QOZ80_5BG0421130 [Eleusine coracana subsp. coracana]